MSGEAPSDGYDDPFEEVRRLSALDRLPFAALAPPGAASGG